MNPLVEIVATAEEVFSFLIGVFATGFVIFLWTKVLSKESYPFFEKPWQRLLMLIARGAVCLGVLAVTYNVVLAWIRFFQ